MRELTPQARVAMLAMYALAFILLCISVANYGLPVAYLPTFAVLAALNAVMSNMAVQLPNSKTNHTFGELFCYAALFLLPLSWAVLVNYARVPADMYRRHREKKPRTWLSPLWNASMNVVLGYAAISILTYYGAKPPRTPENWLVLTLVAIGFVVGQVLLVYSFWSLKEQKSWKALDLTVTPEGFTVDVLQAYFGAILASWWDAASLAIPLTILLSAGLFRVIKLGMDASEFPLDSKTQLYNARHFEVHLALAIDKSLKRARPASLVFADLDHLRDINNTHGHLIGDLALTTVAAVLRQPTLPGYVASRFGGEEFTLLLPNVAKNDAIILADQLRSTLESTPCTLPSGDKITVTMSVGVATCPDDARTSYDLIRAADHAMYHAKAAGRNRVAWAGVGQLTPALPDSRTETGVAEA